MKLSTITLTALALLLATSTADAKCKASYGDSSASAVRDGSSDSSSVGGDADSSSSGLSGSASFSSSSSSSNSSASTSQIGSLPGSSSVASSSGSSASQSGSDASSTGSSSDASNSGSSSSSSSVGSTSDASSDAGSVGSDASGKDDASGSSSSSPSTSSSGSDSDSSSGSNYNFTSSASTSTSGSVGDDSDSSDTGGGLSKWLFKSVTSVQARVQGDKPVWNALNQRFISSYGSSFDAQYLGVTDTVNMAAVEGAFKYVQAECINASAVVNCQRKNKIKYVVFYETMIVQPRAAMAFYQNDKTGAVAIEHCPFIPMDGGQCTPKNGVLPKTCDQYLGVNGQPKLGMCVGGTLQDNDYLAPYPNNYWFSYPNSCPTKVWADKTSACRLLQPGGLCPLGVKPDGILCTFSYKILGYVLLDDVVGITSMTNPKTGKTYADYAEFCNAGGVEYNVHTSGGELSVVETIPFWSEPADRARNTARVKTLVDTYNEVVQTSPKTADGGVMQPLPSVAALTRANPHCYENSHQCAKAPFGCRRSLYSQICEVCSAAAADCVVKPAGFSFPSLV